MSRNSRSSSGSVALSSISSSLVQLSDLDGVGVVALGVSGEGVEIRLRAEAGGDYGDCAAIIEGLIL